MIVVSMLKRGALSVLALAVLAAVASVPASAAGVDPAPAWQVFPVVGPTNLFQTQGERSEVQEVEVEAAQEGAFTLSFEGSTTQEIACGASTQTVQAELESLGTIGAGNVSLAGGPRTVGACESSFTYMVTFTGTLADKSLPAIVAAAKLEPSNAQVLVRIATPGRGGWGKLAIYVVDAGGAPSSGTITVTDRLPAGITTYETPADTSETEGPGLDRSFGGWACAKGAGLKVVTCTHEEAAFPGLGPGSPEFFGKANLMPLIIPLQVETKTPGQLTNQIEVSGGSAAPVTVQEPITISPAPATPGLEVFDSRVYEANGEPATQAGAHPFAITTGFFVHTILNERQEIVPSDEVKNIETKLPPGLIGNPQAIPQCNSHGALTECPFNEPETQAGVAASVFGQFENPASPSGVWSIVPEAKAPAEFGFMAFIVPVYLRASVRSDGDYSVTVSALDTLQTEKVYGSIVTFWGKPNEPIHDEERCKLLFAGLFLECSKTKAPNTPFLTVPTDCLQQADVPPDATMEVSYWQHPEEFLPALRAGLAPVAGCDHVPFHPSLHVHLTQHTAASPTGVLSELHMPQVDNEDGIAEADVKKAVVTLPEGMTISPASAGGLSACSESQIGLTSAEPVRFNLSAPSCPESSKLGTATVDTPLLPNPLKGNLYLAEQGNNPFGTLLAVYLYVDDPVSGVEVKVAGRIDPDPITGRITATFDDLPQLAWGDVRLSFKQGPRAPIMTPTTCGTFVATSDITPTSLAGTGPSGEAVAGGSDVLSTDSVSIEGCKQRTFQPSFVAGTRSNQAGSFSPFTLTLGRNSDEEAPPRSLDIAMPQGVSGMLSKVPLCGEPQAAQGACSPDSEIGHVTVIFGDGPNPLQLPEAGKPEDPVYLTGPYQGAPFGLSVVVPAEAGPFNLGKVVVRAKVEVDPQTAQVKVSTGAMPTILRGVPTDLKTVNVAIDREGFTLNPTNCNPMSVTGNATSTAGEATTIDSRFQAADCRALKFKPHMSVSTTGKTSRRNGAGLSVKLTYPSAPLGSQANISMVKVELPKQLPSRLSTLQQACPDSTFDANPAACPAASRVGTATATTPILPVAMTGPAYFVSHGGQKWPELIVVLQGYGVTVQLHGETFISKGITSSTFRHIPDVPIGTFRLQLPQGPYSALAANGSLCRSRLRMPTLFVAQNGRTIKQSLPIAATGCAHRKPHHKHHKHKKNRKR